MSEFVTQVETFVRQYVPQAALDQAVVAGVVALVLGVVLSVLGAKLARFALVCAGIVAGGYVGVGVVAHDTGIHPLLCVVASAAILGAVAFLSFRLWVGILAASLVSALALGTFSYQRVLPYVSELQVTAADAAAQLPPPSELSLPSAERVDQVKASALDRLREFWDVARTRDARLEPQARSLGLIAGGVGLIVGLAAVRFSLILCTSFIGTVLVGSGLSAVLGGLSPGFYRAAAEHAGLGTSALAVCFVISLILQARLTRPEPPGSSKASE